MKAAVEEAKYQQTPTNTIKPKEVAEESQPPTIGTTVEEQGVAETTSGTKTEADNVGRQCNLIQTTGK